jgi:gamma-glutamylcyclotransferase (GGCT)/AIG2-like uncharacterized protein YtfP
MGDCLFFYGTLIAGSGNPQERAAHAALGEAQAGSVAGALYAIPDPLGWYPALVAGEGRVFGMAYRMTSALDLAALDAYEGAEYRRASVWVETATGTITAQAYLWHGALPENAIPIPQGNFAQWLAQHGFAAYVEP